MYDDLTDHDLLAGGVHDLAAENAAAARRLARMLEFHRRRAADPPGPSPLRDLTPLQHTVVEAGELWGLSPGRVRSDLRRARVLSEHFPVVWGLWLDGALDGYRAGLVADAATAGLDEAAWPELAERMSAWLTARLRRPGDAADVPVMVCCSVKQLRNKLSYETAKLRPRAADERFRRAFEERRASARTHPLDGGPGDGMGTLTLHHSVDRVQLADYRLTLAAKAARAAGDRRTLDQLRTDLAMDLLTGTATIDAGVSRLEAAAEGDPAAQAGLLVRHPAPAYARPIVNVTVPLQTVMGLSDDAGVLSGGDVVPATLARMIAAQPGSTWHRMLTDEAGRCVEVSTEGYRPTAPIWNDVVARHSTCFRPGCDRPASGCPLDHRVPFPRGRTSNRNLQPACERDHRAKHAPGFSMTTLDGQHALATRAGFRHPVTEADQPAGRSLLTDDLLEFQHTAAEFYDTLVWLGGIRRLERSGPLDLVDELWPDAA